MSNMSHSVSHSVEVAISGNAYIIRNKPCSQVDGYGIVRIYYLPENIGTLQANLKLNPTQAFSFEVTMGPNVECNAQRCTCEKANCVFSFDLGLFQIREHKYHFLEIRCKTLDPNTVLKSLNGLSFSGPASSGLKFNIGKGPNIIKTVPSVHLWYKTTECKDVSWFYNEMIVPNGFDHLGSYYMANGSCDLYSGLQVNSETERRVLFSVWSNFKTDDPRKVPSEYRVQLLLKDKDVVAQEFGNEGSGGQSFLRYNWQTGLTYKFLVCAQQYGDSTIFTLYFGAPEWSNLRLIARWAKPKTGGKLLSGLYSFIEHFNHEELGYLPFKAYYCNQWILTSKGEWKELTQAKMSTTSSASVHQRYDIDGGMNCEKFLLQTGGFDCVQKPDLLQTTFSRWPTGQPPILIFNA